MLKRRIIEEDSPLKSLLDLKREYASSVASRRKSPCFSAFFLFCVYVHSYSGFFYVFVDCTLSVWGFYVSLDFDVSVHIITFVWVFVTFGCVL